MPYLRHQLKKMHWFYFLQTVSERSRNSIDRVLTSWILVLWCDILAAVS